MFPVCPFLALCVEWIITPSLIARALRPFAPTEGQAHRSARHPLRSARSTVRTRTLHCHVVGGIGSRSSPLRRCYWDCPPQSSVRPSWGAAVDGDFVSGGRSAVPAPRQVHLLHAHAPQPRRRRYRQLVKPPTMVLLGCTPPSSWVGWNGVRLLPATS